MATIIDYKNLNNSAIRAKTDQKSITKGNVADRLDAAGDELLNRGIITVETTADLQLQSATNTLKVAVSGLGLFTHTMVGPADNITKFTANEGGFWQLKLGAYKKETIEIENESTATINWTNARLLKFGQWPSFSTWIQNGTTWRQAPIEWAADDPETPTQFTADFGGLVNAKIIIG